MNKWHRHIATGSMVVALGVASMVLPGLVLAGTNSYGNQDMGANSNPQMNGSSGSNSTGHMGSGDNMGSGMSHGNMSSMSKHEVTQIQNALNQSGDHLSVDGIMGPHTISALRKYQQSHGLQATGRPNPQTLQKLGINQ